MPATLHPAISHRQTPADLACPGHRHHIGHSVVRILLRTATHQAGARGSVNRGFRTGLQEKFAIATSCDHTRRRGSNLQPPEPVFLNLRSG